MAAGLAGMMFAAAAGSALGGASLDALFFARFGVRDLPWMYIILGLVTFANLVVIAGLLGSVERQRLFTALPLVIAGLLAAARVLIALDLRGVYPAMYVGKEALNALQGVFLWGVAGAALDARQSKRIYPLLIGGSIAGTAAGSFLTPALVSALQVENLILLWMLASLAAAGIIYRMGAAWSAGAPAQRVGRRAVEKGQANQFIAEIRQGYDYVRSSELLRTWSLAAVLFSILWFSLLLPFSRAAAQQYPDAGELAGFLGIYQGLQTAAALLLSLFLTNRLYARFGLIPMMAVYPLIYLGGFLLLAIRPAFSLIAGVRYVKLVWGGAVAEPAWQATFNVIPAERKDQARAFINAVPGQAGIVISGLLLAFGDQALTPQQLYLVGLAAALACTFTLLRARRAHTRALTEALLRGQPQVFGGEMAPFGSLHQDAAALAVVLGGLRSSNPGVRRLSAEILGRTGAPQAIEGLRAARQDEEAEVRLAALAGLTERRATLTPDELESCLADNDPGVRKQAVKLAGEQNWDTSRQVLLVLADPEPEVRAQAAVSLAGLGRRFGSASGSQAAALSGLWALLGSALPEERSLALAGLGECWQLIPGARGEIEAAILAALGDAEPGVRQSAARALDQPGDRLLPGLMAALRDPAQPVSQAAADSLGRMGAACLDGLLRALEDPQCERGALRALAALQAKRLFTPEAEAALRAHSAARIKQAVRDNQRSRLAGGCGGEASAMLRDAYHRRAVQVAILALQAAALLGDRPEIELAVQNLQSQTRDQRAYALETLEATSQSQLIRPLLQIWEEPAGAGEERGFSWQEGLADPESWIRVCTALAARRCGEVAVQARIAELAEADPEGWVREAAAGILRGDGMETLQTLTLMERALFLRGVPLFSSLAPGDLIQVAQIGQEKFYPHGETIIREGEMGDEVFVIVSGEVRVLVEGGREIARRKAGEYVGEMSILSREPRIATLVAEGEVRTLCIGQAQFEGILRERPETSLAVIRVLCERLKELTVKNGKGHE